MIRQADPESEIASTRVQFDTLQRLLSKHLSLPGAPLTMKKIALLISVLAVSIGYACAQPLLAQDQGQRPQPEREALDASRGWWHQSGNRITVGESNRPLAPTAPEAANTWSKIVYQDYIGNWDVFVMNGDGSSPIRLTSSGGADITPRLNRGATRLVYASNEPGNYEIYAINPNGTGRVRLTNQSANDYNPAWSPNGAKIAFNSYRDGQSEVYVMNTDGSGQTRLTFSPDYDGEPIWSPDGSKIAFVSIRELGQQIYVMNADGSNVIRLTSASYPEFPSWSPDGSQIAFSADADGDGWLELAAINADGSNQHFLYDTGGQADFWVHSWSPDGRTVAGTLISFINYQGNWYWVDAYVAAWNVTTNQLSLIGTSNTAWHPDWQSTDLLPPTSNMTTLPATSPSPFVVRWNGSDAGASGILGYDVQVKDGVGAWTSWLTRTTATSANYPGIGGHTYSFRVRAVDNSSNAQVWPTSAQASTTVEALPPTSTVNLLPAYWRGDLTVSWGGSDSGGSGIATYDVQYRDGEGGTWTDWQMGTTAVFATYNGTAGHTYFFRARATDRAQNLGDWSSIGENSATTFYKWQVSGMVYDVRDRLVPDALLVTSPSSLNTINSTLRGYNGYVTADSWHSLTVTKPGFGSLPETRVMGDDQADFWLPPYDNQIQNGDFDTGEGSLSAWHATGQVTTTILPDGHTGKAAQLSADAEPQFAPAEVIFNGTVSNVDLDVDTAGKVHVIFQVGSSITYTYRSPTGTWSLPVSVADAGNEPDLAVTPSGEVHVVWTTLDGIYYRYTNAGGVWSEPTLISVGSRAPKIKIAHQSRRPHLAYLNVNHTYYMSQSAPGSWTTPLMIWQSGWAPQYVSPPQFDLTSNDQPQIIAGDPNYVEFCQVISGAVTCERLLIPYTSMCSLIDANDGSHVLSWSQYWDPTIGYYGYKSSSTDFQFSTIPNYHGDCAMSADDAGVVYVINYAASPNLILRYKPIDGPWSTSKHIVPEPSGNPRLLSDSSDRLHLVYQNSQGLVYRTSIAPQALTQSTISQAVNIPTDIQRATLSLMYLLQSNNPAHPGDFEISIVEDSLTTPIFSTTKGVSDWTHLGLDISHWAGKTVTLVLALENSTYPSSILLSLDEISLGSWLTPDPQAITPEQIKVATTPIITITGDNFIAPVQVKLNDTPLPNATWINTNTITAAVPLLPFGRYDVIVTNAGGQASGLADALLVGYEVYLPLIHK
jgi:hypothetical protein